MPVASPQKLPDPVATAQALATLNDWRAILAVAMFIIASFATIILAVMIWDRIANARIHEGLRVAVDKVADALWALRLTIAEDRVLAREDRLDRKAEAKEERALAHEDRARFSGGEKP